MKVIFFLIISFEMAFSTTGQVLNLGDSLNISFVKIVNTVKDSTDLFCSVVYKNISNRPINIYRQLSNGYYNDRFSNVNAIIQKQIGGKYVNVNTTFYDQGAEVLFSDSLRHIDLPKSQFPPLASDTLRMDLNSLGAFFDTGSFRVRLNLRIQTIQDLTPYQHDPTGATVPPVDKLDYFTSDWMYFKVIKTIYSK